MQKLHNNEYSLLSSIMRFLKILRLEQDISEWPKCQMTSQCISEQPSETYCCCHIIIIVVVTLLLLLLLFYCCYYYCCCYYLI